MSDLAKLEKNLKIIFKNKDLLIKSLTHKSANQIENNEKLEFLGDRVIGLVLANKLIDLYPDEKEGVLDKRFATLVNRNTCCLIAWNLGLQNYIIQGNKKIKINKKDEKILSDACEAFIGALYLDRGFDYVKNFILYAWKKNLDESIVTILDSKTKLQEYSLKVYKKLPIYKLVNSHGPRHNPTYKISVSISGVKPIIGVGKSKQQAEQNGAHKLLKLNKLN